jgi:2-oxoisovalerate dehydrogenase E1 component
MESVAVHTPGVDVFLPSTAGDAAGLLNAAFDSGRPTIFFYPKSLLNDRTQSTSKDVPKQFVPIGKARQRRIGEAITLVGWGNTMPLLEKAAAALEKVGSSADVFDLRSLSPWDETAILASVRKTKRIIVAQEDNNSASMASEIMAIVAEKAGVEVACRRVSRPDTFVPCNFGNQLEVLPSYQRILTEAVELLGGTLRWELDAKAEAGFTYVEAVGSSPSDESVTVVEWKVKVGDVLKPGMVLAELEADKAAFEMSCPMAGTLKEILVPVGDMVKVGTAMLKVAVGSERVSKKPLTHENPGTPIIELPSAGKSVMDAVKGAVNTISRTFGGGKPSVAPDADLSSAVAGIVAVSAAPGSRLVTNDDIAKTCPSWEAEEIFKRIGIESRYWASPDEDTVSLAVRAASDLLRKEGMTAADLSAIICTSGTPVTITPSLACLVLDQLATNLTEKPLIAAWDISAACSGYLYALQAAYDHLANNPQGRVLLVTSEVLSRLTDPADESTAPIFGDAASATLLVGAAEASRMRAILERPVLAAKAENGEALSVPLAGNGEWIHMNGPKVFQEAVSHMTLLLERACTAAGIKPTDLDLVVPHQANQRILNAVRQKARLPEGKVYSNIKNFGNTSSSSIPLALERILASRNLASEPQLVGLAAFGGGFTFAGAVMKLRGGR